MWKNLYLKHPLRNRKAFTLIEVIISIFLISLISLVLFSLLNHTILISNISHKKDDILSNGRFGFEYISREIQRADKVIDSNKFSGFSKDYPTNLGFVIYNYNDDNHPNGNHEFTSYYISKGELFRIKGRRQTDKYPSNIEKSGVNFLCGYVQKSQTFVNFESNFIDLHLIVGNDEFSYNFRSLFNINCETDY